MAINTIKFSQFAAGSLANATNLLAGVTASSGGTNFILPYPFIWTTSTRPSSPPAGLTGYNSSLGQVEYYNGSTWVQLASGGSGSVNLGAQYQLAYYATTGTAVSGLMSANNSILTTNGSGVLSWSTSLPSALTIPQPNIVGITNGSAATTGSVGEVISSVISRSSSVSLSSNSTADVTSITLSAGQWLVFGNVFFEVSSGVTSALCWQNIISMSLPDVSLIAGQTAPSALGGAGYCVPSSSRNVSTSTPVYLSVQATFGSGTVTACGGIYALRVR